MSFKLGIVRTDSIGDVVLTLPMAGVLKNRFPDCDITFIGRTYTGPIIKCSSFIDRFADWTPIEEQDAGEQLEWMNSLDLDTIIFALPDANIMSLARRAGIEKRIATAGRIQSWKYANIRPRFSRKNSDLHEAVLNFKLLASLGIDKLPSESDIPHWYGFQQVPPTPVNWEKRGELCRIILHPKSQGSAVEWGVEHFNELIDLLEPFPVEVVITGTQGEYDLVKDQLHLDRPHVRNSMGQLSLDELIGLVNTADALIAASTGPLHIAAACGRLAIGLYTPQRPMHPGRWKPLGVNAHFLVAPQHPAPGEFLAIKANDVLHLLRHNLPTVFK